MVSKVVIFCTTALLIQTTFGQCLRNIELTSECGCRSSSSRTRSSNGSGSVRAIGIGNFKNGKFISGNSNTEASSNSESSSCVCNTFSSSADSTELNASDLSSDAVSSVTGSSSDSRIILTNAPISSNYGFISNVARINDCSGGPFIVNCYGPVAPSGISVSAYSDLIGDLVVSGQLPFLSAVAFDGAFQNAGKASVAYGCGDGNLAIQEIIGAKPGSCGYIL